MSELTIGDTNRDGTIKITDTQWDSNGTLRVTVVDLTGQSNRLEAMRRLARRALMYPEKTRSSRVLRTFHDYGCTHVTFAVSRIES